MIQNFSEKFYITPDWLLVWKQNDKELILVLVDTGSHSASSRCGSGCTMNFKKKELWYKTRNKQAASLSSPKDKLYTLLLEFWEDINEQ